MNASCVLNKLKYIGNRTGALNYYRYFKKMHEAFCRKAHYAAMRDGFAAYPSKFTFELTNKCNLSCRVCFQKNNSRAPELSLGQIDRVLDNLGPRAALVNLTGAEIFMRNDLFQVLDLIKNKHRKKCYLTTNGTLIDENIAVKLCSYDNITGIQLSLDGPEDVHNFLRGSPSAFKKTINAIKLMKGKFRISICCVIAKENVEYLSDLVVLLEGLGVHDIAFAFEMFSTQPKINDSENILNAQDCNIAVKFKVSGLHDYSFDALMRSVADARESGKSRGVNVGVFPDFSKKHMKTFYDGRLRGERKLGCRALLEGRVNFNGDLIHCHLIKMPFGNLLADSFGDIWNCDKFKSFRKKLFLNNLLSVCERCCKVEVI